MPSPQSTSVNIVADVKAVGEALTKEILKEGEPSPSRCVELVDSLMAISTKSKITISVLEETMLGKTLGKTIKSFKRHRRNADPEDADEWLKCITDAEKILLSLKEQVSAEHNENKAKKAAAAKKESLDPGLPRTVGAYLSRLQTQKKEIYKNPPVLPRNSVKIEDEYVALPKRNNETGELTFVCSEDDAIKAQLKDFRPNRTPEEILRAGSFGGTYFRPIVSAVTNVRYRPADVIGDTLQPEWINGLNKANMLTSSTYRPAVNKYKVKCGGSLGMWESSGWITDSDPYGWFQWYCRFYRGRRCDDDSRQISRWLKSAGPKGRFRSQLCNKIFAAGGMKHVMDTNVSPVIRQTLLHWGLEITEDVLRKHGKRVGKL